MKNRRKAVQPFEIKKRKIDIFRNYEANGFEKNQRKFENFSTLISKKSSRLKKYAHQPVGSGTIEEPQGVTPLFESPHIYR